MTKLLICFLFEQLQKLSGDLKQSSKGGEDKESDNGKRPESELEAKPSLSSLERSEHVLGVLSDDDSCMKADYNFGPDEAELLSMNMADPAAADSSLTSPEDWGSLNSEILFDESTSGYQWWDFWS